MTDHANKLLEQLELQKISFVSRLISVFSHIYFSTVCLQIIVLAEFRYDEYIWVLLPESGVSDRDSCLSMPEIPASGEPL